MFELRIKKLRALLAEENLDAVLISAVSNITYFTGYANFSQDEREAYIFLGQNFGYIITDARYCESIKKQVPHLQLFERSPGKRIDALFKKHKKQIKKLGIEEDNLVVSEHKILQKHFKKLKHFNASLLRSIKSEDEIQKIEKAANLGDQVFKYILGKIKAGISEKQLAQELESYIKKHGAELSFPPIVAFGKNSSIPHHQTGNTKLTGDKEFILLDFGVKFENYCSDMTRTVFFGKPTKEQKAIFETVLKAQQKAINFVNSAIKSGKELKAAQVDKVARDYIISKNYPAVPHSLGHGVGLDVHESPRLSRQSREILKEGMVFSIEPGIYSEGFGGVRIEDLFVLEKKGIRQLTNATKKLITI
ncbi:Xaa-Pro peptidase family protein [Patescibacteria group bacterium]|nr:Xaa-Pro peptidase family protein [Patescibacteria group bacterium]